MTEYEYNREIEERFRDDDQEPYDDLSDLFDLLDEPNPTMSTRRANDLWWAELNNERR
jgi:hypothetical protein